MAQVITHVKLQYSRSTKRFRRSIILFKEKHFTPHLDVVVDLDKPSPIPAVFISMPPPVHSERPAYFVLPDLVSHCKFELNYHPKGDKIAQQSVNWLDSNCPDLNPKQRKALRGLQAGELTAFCYNTCLPERLRVVSDFMNYLFHLYVFLDPNRVSVSPGSERDNISDGMMTRETDILSDCVMNALWLSEKYAPTKSFGKEQPADELNPGKLARECVSLLFSL